MIETKLFQINLIGIIASLFLLFLLYKKTLDLISILALTSAFYNLVIFNFKPWTFGFQIFFLFAIIFIILSLKNVLVNLKNKNKNKLILLTPVFLFFTVVLLGEIFAYLNEPQILVVRPQGSELKNSQEIFKFSRLNITQFLYLVFFFMIFISLIFQENVNYLKIFKFYLLGLNLNLLFQLFEIFSFSLYKDLPKFLINFSFTQDTIQRVYLKHFEFYRISGLFPAPSLLGIYLFIGMLILILFKENFSKKFYSVEFFILILSGLIGLSGTFLLSLIIILLILVFKEKKYSFLPFLFLFLPLTIYFLYRQTFTIRLQNALFSLKIFLKYPLLGIGIGSHFSDDLLTSFLANTGILGTFSFILIFLLPLIRSLKAKNNLLLKLSYLNLMPLILILLLWNSLNVNIFWLTLGIWYNKIVVNNVYSNR